MRLVFGIFRKFVLSPLAAVSRDRSGNVAITVALCLMPMMLTIGFGLDYTRAYNVQSKMQSDLDAALVAAVKGIDEIDEDKLVEKIRDWFEAQGEKHDSTYDLTEIVVDKDGHTIRATANGSVPTTLMTLASIKSVPVGVVSAIEGPATSYLEVYIVVDKSPSMLLAATTEGQQMLRADPNISCEFACHSTGDPVRKDKNGAILADTYYDYITDLGVKLRTDVALDAVDEVLDMIDKADEGHTRIKVGLYALGETISEVLAPTYSTSTARKKLSDDSSGLTSATSMQATYFQMALRGLRNEVGKAGDGSSASSPLKLVLLLTDGAQSERNWVLTTAQRGRVTPLNPEWCDYLKNNKVTMAVLYTEYLALPLDWGYNATLAQSMASSQWTSLWGGKLRSGVSGSTTRHDYVPMALQDCASSAGLFISAASEAEITAGLSTLFDQYLTSVRLTQ